MNILQIVSSSRVSGAEKHVAVLSERLRQRGHRVVALCPPGDWLPHQLRDAGAEVIESKMNLPYLLSASAQFKRLVEEHSIDVIHAHLTRATYMGYMLGKMTGKSVVSSVHVRTHDLVYRVLFPQPQNHIITVSDWVRAGFIQQGVPASQIHTIHNGTEFASEAETLSSETHTEALPVHAEFSLPPDAQLIGIFARVNEFKGHYLLANAMRQIVERRPQAYLLCVGPVDAKTQKALWEIAAAGGVSERIRFTHTRNDVQRLLAAVDVVTLPSRFEACSMAIIEAMAMGKPVVATLAGGNPELIAHGETGLLIERNPKALAEAIIAMLEDPQRRSEMGNAAKARALSHFSAQVMVDKVEALYQRILQTEV